MSGLLFGNDTLSFGGAGAGGTLYTMDPLSGVASAIGSTGFNDIFALAFNQTGSLFGIDEITDQLIEIDTTTAGAAVVGATGLVSSFDIASVPGSGIM